MSISPFLILVDDIGWPSSAFTMSIVMMSSFGRPLFFLILFIFSARGWVSLLTIMALNFFSCIVGP